MISLQQQLETILQQAISQALGSSATPIDPCLSPATNPQFGDFQANFAMRLAKPLKKNPRDIAEEVVKLIPEHPLIDSLDVAGPGFINIRLSHEAITKTLLEQHQAPQFGLPERQPSTIVVDYGGANVAKELHVGHLRSAVIGDAIARLLTYLGHDVIIQNHLGDWGTQFGMLIEYIRDESLSIDDSTPISLLNTWYQAAKKKFDQHPGFAERAKARVVSLQQGHASTLTIWKQLVAQSEMSFDAIYQRLQLLMKRENNCGESFYNDRLAPLVQMLTEQQLAVESDQAKVIFLPGFVDRDKKPLPMIIQKSDGGFLYATTDLAAAQYRLKDLHANRLIYVTDARQKQHFSMLFAAINAAGWTDTDTKLDHIAFGSVLGENKKPFKTRSGESIRLSALLDEAQSRLLSILKERNTGEDINALKTTAEAIGIGAIKYADLSTERQRDYVFNWDQMLAFTGNTGPYLQNALVRIHAIFRKIKQDIQSPPHPAPSLRIETKEERALALQLTHFPGVLTSIEKDLAIHQLCHYLFELAACFHHFYEHCSVLKAPSEASQQSRLTLCRLTAKTLGTGLTLLGITPLEKM